MQKDSNLENLSNKQESAIILNDTLDYFQVLKVYYLDLTADGSHDVRFNFYSRTSASNSYYKIFKVILLNPAIRVAVTTELDTLCQDTLVKSGFETYYTYNCHSLDYIRVDTTIFAPWFDLTEANSASYAYNTNDTILITELYQDRPFSTHNGPNSYNIQKGISNKSKGYMVFVDSVNIKKVLEIEELNGSYIVMHQLVTLK